VNVPTNSILTIHKQSVIVHPIADQYYERNPYHRRSVAFVTNKGLTANEKTPRLGTPLASPAAAALEHMEHQKKLFGPSIPFVSRSHTPETSSIPRVRTPLSVSETVASTSDIRSLTAPPPPSRSSSQQPPSQGNIKKKRKSLTGLDGPAHLGGVGNALMEPDNPSPLTPEPTRSEFGNPQKIAQFFPELGGRS
jgi:glutamine amidotransferase